MSLCSLYTVDGESSPFLNLNSYFSSWVLTKYYNVITLIILEFSWAAKIHNGVLLICLNIQNYKNDICSCRQKYIKKFGIKNALALLKILVKIHNIVLNSKSRQHSEGREYELWSQPSLDLKQALLLVIWTISCKLYTYWVLGYLIYKENGYSTSELFWGPKWGKYVKYLSYWLAFILCDKYCPRPRDPAVKKTERHLPSLGACALAEEHNHTNYYIIIIW